MITKRKIGWLVLATGLCVSNLAGAKDPVPPPVTAKAGATADLNMLPADSEVIMGLNLAQLQQSALWQTFVQPKLMQGDFAKKMGEFTAKCGFDPMTAMKSVTFGMKGLDDKVGKKPEGVVIARGLEKAKIASCLDKMKADIKKSGDDITRDGDVFIIKPKTGEQVVFTFTNDTTAVVVIGPKATKDGVKAVLRGGSKLAKSKAFLDMYKKTNTNDTVWLLINGRSSAFDQISAMGVKPKAAFGSINITKDLAGELRLRLASPDEAKNTAKTMQSMVGQAAVMFDKLAVSADGVDLKISAEMSQQKLMALIKLAGGMMGGGTQTGRTP